MKKFILALFFLLLNIFCSAFGEELFIVGQEETVKPISGDMTVSGEDIAPAELTATAKGMEVNLRWVEKKQGVSYQILRSSVPDGEYIKINKIDILKGNSFVDNEENSIIPPISGITYYYRLIATDEYGNQFETPLPVSATPYGELLPPTDVVASARLLTVTVRWAQPASEGKYGLKGYNIFRAENETDKGIMLNKQPIEANEYVDNGEITGLDEGKKYYYYLQSVDMLGNTSAFSVKAPAVPYSVISGPLNVTAVPVSGQSIKISWDDPDMTGTFGIAAYNIFRSNDPLTFPETPINLAPFKPYRDEFGRVFYYDNMILSRTPPDTGIRYYYKVVPVDANGNSGAASEVVSAKIDVIELPKSGFLSADISQYGLPADSNLKISGMKSIKLGWKDGWPGLAPVSRGFIFEQRFRVILNGNIGKKIFVDVNYDDDPALQGSEYTKISISYSGDKEEVLQEASFGDITLNLPYTKWASYSQTLFGIKGRIKLGDKFEFIGIGAQTKGISDTTSFIGNMRKKITNGKPGYEILDTAYYNKVYYYLTKDPSQVGALAQNPGPNPVYIKPGTVQVYVDNGIADDGVNTVFSYPNKLFRFERKYLGSDFTIDYRTGLIKFTGINIGDQYTIAVAYETTDGQKIGFAPDGSFDFNEANLVSNPNGYTSSSAHLIQDGRISNPFDISHRAMNIYYIGETQIENPATDRSFVIKIKDKNGQDVSTQLPQPYEAGASQYYEIDPELGLLKFKAYFPFTVPNTFPGDYNNNTRVDGAKDAYAQTQVMNYRIYLEYNYRVNSYRVDNFPVVFGSERVYVDGRLLKKDTDYNIFYETGDITFVNPQLIQPNTRIEISYEYLQSFMTYQNNVLGARAEYKLLENDSMTLGSTFLYKGSNTGNTVPDARSGKERLSTPAQLWMLDADAKLRLNEKQVNQVIGAIPFVGETALPVEINSQAEMAYSDFNVNIFEKNKEKGVAMIDAMEGADNAVSLSTNRLSWFPASIPVGFLPQNRIYTTVDNVTETGHSPVSSDSLTSNQVQMLKVNFSGMTSDNWDARRYIISRYGDNLNQYGTLEMWIYADVNTPVRIGFDIGTVSEDSNGNGQLIPNTKSGIRNDSEDVEGQGIYIQEYDRGIGNGIYGGDSAYWGADNKQLDTEDMNLNGRLDTSEVYYRYIVQLDPGQGWKKIKIPLDKFQSGYNLSPQQADPKMTEFYESIKHIRMFLSGTSGTPASGYIKIETPQFSGNSWKLRAKKGSVDLAGNSTSAQDNSKIEAVSVSQNTDPNYIPNTNFFDYQKDEDKRSEEGLRVTWKLSALDNTTQGYPIYYLTKFLTKSTGYDYGQYKKLKFDILYKNKKISAGAGRIMFIRIGSGAPDPYDETNYYQYNLQLDTIPVDNAWHTVEFMLDGSDGKRSPAEGEPNLRSVQFITIGFLNPNNTVTEDTLYIDNIRLTDPIPIQGTARRIETNVIYKGLGTVNQEFQEIDSNFNTILDMERSQRRQHQRLNRARFDYNQIQFLPVITEASRNEIYTEERYRNDFAYTNDNNAPDQYSDNYRNTVSFNAVPGLALSNVTSYDITDIKYPGNNSYMNARTNTFRINPVVNYSISSQIIGEHRFNNSISLTDIYYDYYKSNTTTATVSGTGYYDQWNMTVDQTHTWDAGYRIGQIALSPAFSYTLKHQKGNLNGIFNYYSGKIGVFNYTDKYLPVGRSISPRFNITGGEIWLFNPRFEYTDTYNLDYVLNAVISSGSMRINTPFALSKILPFMPDISNMSVSVNDNSRRFDEQYMPGTFLKYNSLSFDKRWNIYLLSYLYNEEAVTAVENISYNGSIDKTASVDLAAIKLPFNLSFSPGASYSRRRYSQQRAIQSLNDSFSAMVRDIYIDDVTIPGLDFLVNKERLSGRYSFTDSKTYDPSDIKKAINSVQTHDWYVSLPFRTNKEGDGINGSVGLTGSKNITKNLRLTIWSDKLAPEIAMNYRWLITNPINIPDFIPFVGGKIFKFENSLNFTSRLSADLNTGWDDAYLISTKKDFQIYSFDLSVNYYVLKNISATFNSYANTRVDRVQPKNESLNYTSMGFTLEVKVEF